jgi:hypothetical protein
MRRYGIIHDKRWIDPNGFPITLGEMLMDLEHSTFKYKGEAVTACRDINKSIPAGHNRCYAALIWIDVSGMRAGKN